MKPLRPAALLLILFFCTRVFAAATATQPTYDAVHVYLVTVGPGAEVYEKFGHNMIRIVGPAAVLGQDADVDIAVNWGMFSFDQPHFIWRFIHGRMLYSSGAEYYADEFAEYKQSDRSMWQQELNLSADQKERLWHVLIADIQPANRDYRYDYYRDNCSTRTRDALDETLDGQIRAQLENIPTDSTYRWHTRRLIQGNFWLYTGLQYILGHPVDQKINAWQECFLPVRMMDWMNHITIADAAGNPVPLVLNHRQLLKSKEFIDAAAPPHWIPIYAAIGTWLAIIFLIPLIARSIGIKLLWSIVAIGWTALGGAAGSILVWGTFYTDHVVIHRNENLLQLSPIMVALLVLIPFAAWGKRWALNTALVLASLQAFFGLLGLLLKHFPVFNQPNFEIIALALPANIALAIGLVGMRRRLQSPSDAQ